MNSLSILNHIIDALSELPELHAPTSKTYQALNRACIDAVQQSVWSSGQSGVGTLDGIGELCFPYEKMGAVDTLDLFGLDELILFAFYAKNVARYKSVGDLGANLGIHSIVLNQLGYVVTSYEPDPVHAELMRRNLSLNECKNVNLVEAAVSNQNGEAEFTRVKGNTTSSHLSGVKANPYGELDRFKVNLIDFKDIAAKNDLIKMDVEGHEATLILSLDADMIQGVDILLEVGSDENAQKIFDHSHAIGAVLFAQKKGWRRVDSVDDMPTSYRDGSLFMSVKTEMSWG